jgi:hypothetical protein
MVDLGQQTIRQTYDRLRIDKEWSTSSERSFSWIAHRLEQTVSATGEVQDNEFRLFGLKAETPVVENVKADSKVVHATLSDLNRFAFGNCYSFVAEERRIYSTMSMWIHRDTASWRARLFDLYAIGQLCFAEPEADFLADRCAGDVAIRAHRTSGGRELPDEMLGVLEDVVVSKGYEANQFVNGFEFDAVAEAVNRSPKVATLGSSPKGIALECGFGDYTSLSVLSADQPHRRLGVGLVVRVQVPTEIGMEDGCRIAATLNRHERSAGPIAPHVGAWCVDATAAGRIAVTYRSFLPNFAFQSGLIMDSAWSCMTRMNWVDQKMNAQKSTTNPWQRMANGLRALGLRR